MGCVLSALVLTAWGIPMLTTWRTLWLCRVEIIGVSTVATDAVEMVLGDYKPPMIDDRLKPELKDFTRVSYSSTPGEYYAKVEPIMENYAYNFVAMTRAAEEKAYLNFVIDVLDHMGYDVTKREEV